MCNSLAYTKGRAKSRSINVLCQRSAAYQIGCEVKWRVRHWPTDRIVADGPSRGISLQKLQQEHLQRVGKIKFKDEEWRPESRGDAGNITGKDEPAPAVTLCLDKLVPPPGLTVDDAQRRLGRAASHSATQHDGQSCACHKAPKQAQHVPPLRASPERQ